MKDQEYSYLHVFKVRRILQYCIDSLLRRFEHHDEYKLDKEGVETNHLLPQYISQSYNPENHLKNFLGMSLLDVLELVSDIMSETVTKEQALQKIRDIKVEYNLSDDLEKIMFNTVSSLDRFYRQNITLRDKLEHATPISKASTGLTTF